FVEEHKVGLVINSFDDMREQLFESNEIKEILLKKRYEFTIENNINRLIEFYTNLIAQHSIDLIPDARSRLSSFLQSAREMILRDSIHMKDG
ncbi:MAG: hypothetical protein KAT53_08715, partial [Dehalococcoidia bacterium]|nr:hypothetical protein [Dehalococcoidia bacterium]